MAAYVLFVLALSVSSAAGHLDPLTAFGPPLVVVVLSVGLLARPPAAPGSGAGADAAEATTG